ncbi:CRISPR-associated RAMP protein [Sulfolobus sp. B5]|nr:CRISPR-associated RAMP protein [Sulfolobus sp. B5]
MAPLRIGVGRGGSLDPTSIARDTILKDHNGRPVIPGSSWKGIFRSTGERLLSAKNVEVCSGVGNDNCLRKRGLDDDFQNLLKRNKINEALEMFWKKTCLNCKLFGTNMVIGNVRFLDSVALNYSIGMRTMVAISRTEGAAARGALVQVEYVEPGSTFSFKLIGYNLPSYVIGYIVNIMKYIHDGLTQVGGHKSRGFGLVKFSKLKFTSTGDNKIGDEDVKVDLNSVEGDQFFELMKPYIEVFQNAKIQYSEK